MSSRITGTRAWLLSLPPLPIETEPPVSTGCGATLAVPAHAGHHGCIQSCFVVRTRAARNGRAHLSPRLAGCIPLAAVATIPGSPPLPLSLPPPSPSDSSPPPGLIRGVQRPPRTNMGTHLGIADPPAPCRRRRRPCRPRFHPLALLPTPSGRQQKHADRTLRTSPSCSRQAWLAACWGVVFVCVVYSLSTQCIVSEQRTIKTAETPRSPEKENSFLADTAPRSTGRLS